jgi:hypothetical protein
MLFDVAADLEDDKTYMARDRNIFELSLWDVAVAVGLDDHDAKSAVFIERRRERLLEELCKNSTSRFEQLLYAWSRLLRGRRNVLSRRLPGVFEEDADAVVSCLARLGLPRRAHNLARKFQLGTNAVVDFSIKHRPESEEDQRTEKLRERFIDRMPLVPYCVWSRSRALLLLLREPPEPLRINVVEDGRIILNGTTYGITRRRY